MRYFLAGCAGVFLVLATPAAAQEPDLAAVAAAREMLVAQNFLAQMRATAERTSTATFDTIAQDFQGRTGITFPADLEAEVRAIMREYLDRRLASMERTALEEAARVYARHFTADEIIELRRLFQQPVMLRFQSIAPQFTAEMAQIGVRGMVEEMREFRERVNAAIGDWIERNRDRIRPTAT